MPNVHWLRIFCLLAVATPLAACNPLSGDSANAADTGKQPTSDHQDEGQNHGNSEHEGEHEGEHTGQTSGDSHEEEGGGHDEHAGDKRRIHLTSDQRQQLDLKISAAGAGSATAVVQAPATARFDADRVARVGPRLEAKVVEVTKDLGDTVAAGDTVAILDSVELGRAKASYLTAQARFGAALSEYQRDKKLAEDQITSEAELLESRADYQQAKAERDAARAELRLYGLDDGDIGAISVGGEQPLSRYQLTAPLAGTIQRRDLVPGQTVSAQQTPIHIVNNETMWVMIEAFEKDLPRLGLGQQVTLSVRALPNQTFEGKTDWVSRELDEQSRTVRVRAVVPNDDGNLRAGMFGTARIQTDAEQRFALVPVDAVQTVEDDSVVFVPGDEDGAFRAVTVTTGDEGGGQVEIRSGLAAGDRVVTTGAFDLKSALTASGRSAAHSH
ncbi:MAG: efflux RND transporter periplasmic adaptor subunit [Salinisphaeraceae bacterium]|uniref:Efflux RND transporter periplasmic adaptor subunit n=2 Tax=Spectribacter TaxID=3160928 RepID=A0ABU3C2G6_9GAMM|nr:MULTISPECIES: efflux RND transporter periplasmic adaptor subunit [unclassified Salinisphaera]MDT0618398.1 efflux RND transporter periplasmic adaptor subunit [Salinisphaera sp. P385]MDT0635756.1 efflux RND transporter periplasmic adaptor subunit [Salinisphaera sp. W335]